MFGGWNGSAYLNDVWEAEHAVQMEDFRWDQDILPECVAACAARVGPGRGDAAAGVIVARAG